MSYIAKFNPYQMDDKTILNVATGRKNLLLTVLKTLENNSEKESTPQHMLIRGPRGMGKSFFLKYLEINFKSKPEFENSDIILLPEEQNNINSPSDVIRLILSFANKNSTRDMITSWEEPEENWEIELQNLKSYLTEKRKKFKNYVLVVIIENLDELLNNIQGGKKTKELHESRFRHLLEHLNHFVLIGATTKFDDGIDNRYDSRLFHAFKKCNLRRWKEEDYFNYFERRKQIKVEDTGIQYTNAQESLMKAKLKAISQYTGGSPRLAVVLTDLLLEDNVLSTATTLFGLIDDLTPYYQDLTKTIPKNSRKIFDTLIRKGENLSQSQIAELLGATQSQISKAFKWLIENGYILGKKRTDSPAFLYHVADRIFVLYYMQREIYHNENFSPIWLLSDFLVAFYQEDELRNHAKRFLKEKPGRDSMDLARIYLLSAGLNKDELPDFENPEDWEGVMEDVPEYRTIKDEIIKALKAVENFKNQEDEQLSFSDFKNEVDLLIRLLGKCKFKVDKFLERLLMIGLNFNVEKAIYNIYLCEQILELGKIESSKFYSAQIHTMLGASCFATGQHQKVLDYCQIGYKEGKKIQIEKIQIMNLGMMIATYLFLNKKEEALNLLNPENKGNENLYKYFGGGITMLGREKPHAEVFSIANHLLIALKERESWMNVPMTLSYFLANLLEMQISNILFKEICEEALHIFPTKQSQIVIQAALHTVQYLESDKATTYLENLDPDMAIAVEAIVKEGQL